MTHTWQVIALLLLAAGAVLAAVQRTWTLALVAAGLAAWVLPAALQLQP